MIERPSAHSPLPSSVDERIIGALGSLDHPLPFTDLRALVRVRTATLYQRLAALTAQGHLLKSDHGYRLAAP